MIQADPSWNDLLVQLADIPEWKTIFVVGPSDSGKTTFCQFLGRELARSSKTARVDCDPGQSVLGPPACISLGWEPLNNNNPAALRFVGSKTPMGHFLQTLTGINHLISYAHRQGATKVVLDASGYIDTSAGREFFFQAIDLFTPDHLVALQRSDEIEPLLACFEHREKPRLHRLPVAEAAVNRRRRQRILYREQKFGEYLTDAFPQTLSLENVGMHGRVPAFDHPRSYENRLIGLINRQGLASAIGIVEAFEPEHKRLHLYTPSFDPAGVASIQFGALKLNRDGGEL